MINKTYTFNYDNLNFTTICGNTFNVKQIGAVVTNPSDSNICIYIASKAYQISQEAHSFILCFLSPLPLEDK